jgi:hypothetical protein
MKSPALTVGALVCALALLLAPAAAGGGHGSKGSSVSTVEGTVRSLGALPAEGELPVLAVTLAAEEGGRGEELVVLLGPKQTMDEIGFAVEPGDRLRVRVFRSDDGAARAHKVLNLSRGTMVRLRTLRQVPLWNGQGAWQGGPCRSGHGGSGRHRHGDR